MPATVDIIEQLEEGRRAYDEHEYDVNDVRTNVSNDDISSVNSSNDSDSKILPKRSRSKSKTDRKRNQLDVGNTNHSEQSGNQGEVAGDDFFTQAEQLLRSQDGQDGIIKETKEQRVLENPEFNFADDYEIGQRIFFLRVLPTLGIKEIVELNIRTICPRSMVCYRKKGGCVMISYPVRDFVFLGKIAAQMEADKINIKEVHFTSDSDFVKEIATTDEEESDDYIGNETENMISDTEEEN